MKTTLEIDRPVLEVAIREGDQSKVLVTLDGWEFNDMLALAEDRDDKKEETFSLVAHVRDWMLDKGLPSEFGITAVSQWLAAYYAHLESLEKKATGT